MSKARAIDSREVAHSHAKLYLWIIWLTIMIVSAGYCALSFISFQKIFRVYTKDDNGVEGSVLWAVLTASFIGPASVVIFFVFGTLVLLRKTIAETGLTYTFGAMHLSSFWVAVVVLMSAVSLHGQKDLIKTCWEDPRYAATVDVCGVVHPTLPWAKSDTTLVTATFAFAYTLLFCYLALFLVLFILRGAMKKLELKESLTGAHIESSHTHSHTKPVHKEPEATTATSKPLSSLSGGEEPRKTAEEV